MSCGLKLFGDFTVFDKKNRIYHKTVYFSTMQNLKFASLTKEKFSGSRCEDDSVEL